MNNLIERTRNKKVIFYQQLQLRERCGEQVDFIIAFDYALLDIQC